MVIAQSGDGETGCAAAEQELAQLCSARGLSVLLMPDLYHVAEDSGVWGTLADLPGPTAIVTWLQPRASEWLMRRHGVGERGLCTYSLASHDALEHLADTLCAGSPAASGSSIARGTVSQIEEPVSSRWYPVVDQSLCTGCQHCLQFCLFGVYDRDESGGVAVSSPDNCKAGCPACARICPNSAIMFPLYTDDQAICGAPGKLVTLDAAARRMFYARTETPCPACGSEEGTRPDWADEHDACPECGREFADEPQAPSKHVESETLAEIDDLIDQLEDIVRGSQ